jgi:hypothetical protein
MLVYLIWFIEMHGDNSVKFIETIQYQILFTFFHQFWSCYMKRNEETGIALPSVQFCNIALWKQQIQCKCFMFNDR